MTLTSENGEALKKCLETIYSEIAVDMSNRHRCQMRVYIEAWEFGLALDDMADMLLTAKKPLTAKIRQLVDDAAENMQMKTEDSWNAVAELRASYI